MRRLSFALLALTVLAYLPLPVPSLRAEEPKSDAAAIALQQAFVWTPAAPFGKQAYVVFRKTFSLEQPPVAAVLRLFADSRYILWINGKYVDRGPCRFDPIGPEYDTLDVAQFLQPGQNVFAVLVHHYHDGKATDNGDSFSGRIMRHVPGLTASLETTDAAGKKQTMRTDATWRLSTQNRFGPSGVSWTSIPDNIDARSDTGDWTAVAFDDSAWENASAVDGKQWGALRARQIPRLREEEVKPLYVIQRQTQDADPQNLADKPELAKLLPIEMTTGSQIVVDAGRFVQAYSEIEMDADDGSQLELTYAQAFFSSGNKPDGGQWAGANRYTARQGRQTYTSGDTFGCKYVVIRCTSGKVRLLGMKLINRLYPFDVVGKFESNDPLLNEIWKMGVRTIQIVSEDAYVDCATRERVEWLGDAVMVSYPLSRITMAGPGVKGKPLWSDPRLFGNALQHMGQSVQPDGRVKAHHPSNRWDIHGYIEDYSCLWIQALRTWNNNTGDLELIREMWPAVTAQLRLFLEQRTDHGLVKGREFTFFGNPLAYKVCEGATLNAFVAGALADTAELAKLLGDTNHQREYANAAQAIQKAINANLWDETTGTYHGGLMDGVKTPPTAHAAAICLFFDVAPAERRKSVEAYLLKNIGSNEFMPFQYAYCFEDLARMNSEAADLATLDVIRKRWEPMTRFETKTTWESFGPGENCHDMGSPPTIYLSRHVLGVGLDGPVTNRRLVIEPHLGDLKQVEGVVITEFGPVSVRWTRPDANSKLGFELDIPAGVTARVSLPPMPKDTHLKINGQKVQPTVNASTGRISVELGEGKHRGE